MKIPRPAAARSLGLALLLLLIGLDSAFAGVAPPKTEECTIEEDPVPDPNHVFVETPLGTLEIETYSNLAPGTVANFLGYIDRGDYADTVFHRIVPGFVIQTGGFRYRETDIYRFEAIEILGTLQDEPCLSNVTGTIAMAKAGQPNTATSQWFVNLDDNLHLDIPDDPMNPNDSGAFTVFGRLVGNSLDTAIAISEIEEFLQYIPPYYASALTSVWTPFSGSPLLEPLDDTPGAYGCFDVSQSGVLLAENPVSAGDWVPNVALGLDFTLASWACTGGGGAGAGVIEPCERRILELDPATGAFIADENAEFGYAEQTISCDGLTESLASYDARISDLAGQLDEIFVKTAYSVPEPGAGISALACGLTIAALARRRRRTRRG